MVQRRAARFIKSNYSRDSGTVTTLLEQLELSPLSTRRKIARITLLHKAIHEKVAIPIPSYIIKPTRDHLHLLNMFLEMRVPSAAGILKVRSDKRKVCLFLYLLWT
jgi:hypothetical protein